MSRQTTQGPCPPPTSPFFDPAGRLQPYWYVYLQSLGANVLSLQQSFTNFSSWTPTVAGTGGMTVSDVVVQDARYQQYGNVVSVYLAVTFTTGGTPAHDILISTPITPAGPPDGGLLLASVTDSGQVSGQCSINSAYFQVGWFDGANWGLGANKGCVVSGTYRAA